MFAFNMLTRAHIVLGYISTVMMLFMIFHQLGLKFKRWVNNLWRLLAQLAICLSTGQRVLVGWFQAEKVSESQNIWSRADLTNKQRETLFSQWARPGLIMFIKS